jgi:LruC domain-containing protein
VRSEVKLSSVSTTPFVDRLYFTGLRAYRADPTDYVTYTFIALRPCSTALRPYQQAASGTQEKYNADFSATTSRVAMTSGTTTTLQITVEPDRSMVKGGDDVKYTVTYASPTAPVGYPSNGNPLVLHTAIPGQTSYQGGSATETAVVDAEYSTNNGDAWTTVEPPDPAGVTDVRWIVAEPVGDSPRQVEVGVTVDEGYNGSPITLTAAGALYDGTTLVASGGTVTDAAGNLLPLAVDDNVKTNSGTAVTFSVVANDSDADGNLLPASATPTTKPSHGTLSNDGNGTFTYTPARGFLGTDGLTYKVCDSLGACDEASVIIYVGQEQLRWQTSTTYVAYEDLKNVGWSDWDYNDFVVKIDARVGADSAGRLVSMEIDYESLARGAGYAERFVHDLPLEGGGIAMLSLFDSEGNPLSHRTWEFDTNTNFTIFERTVEALPPNKGFFDTNTRSTQPGVVKGYRAKLTIYVNKPDANPLAALPPAPWDPYIYVYYTQQEVHLVAPGHMDNTQAVNPLRDPRSPLVGYDLPLAQTFAVGWRWPEEFQGVWRGYPQYTDYVGSGGTVRQAWWKPENAVDKWLWAPGATWTQAQVEDGSSAEAVATRYFGAPVAADLNGDGWNEVIIGNLLGNQVEVYNVLGGQVAGWPRPTSGGIKAAVAVADLDGDGSPEIVAPAESGELYAWHYNGRAIEGWPAMLHAGYRVLATPAVGDLDKDGVQDVVVPLSDGKLYAIDAMGRGKQGWPVSIGDVADQYGSQVINSSPQLADLDADGNLEIIVGSTDKRIYVFNHDGSQRWIFPTGDMVLSTPSAGEIDKASPGLEIVVGSGDRYVYLLDAGGNLLWRRPTGWIVRSSPAVADIDGDREVEILIGSDDDKVWAWHADGRLVTGWPQTTGADILSSPRVGDVDGDGSPDVVIGSDDAKVWAWHADGSPVNGWPQAMKLSIKGAPLLVNLDDDAVLEVAAADLGGEIGKWNVGATSFRLPVFLPAIEKGN